MRDYELKDVYNALQTIADRQGYDTFAVVFICGEHKKVVKAARLNKIEGLEMDEIIAYL